METHKVSKEDFVKESAWCAKAAATSGELSEADIVEKLQVAFAEVAAEPVHAHRDNSFLMTRAKSKVMTEIAGLGRLEKYSALLIGPAGQPRDSNADDIKKVQDDAVKGGANKVWDMAAKGIIAAVPIVKEAQGGPKDVMTPVSKLLLPMVKTKDGKWIVQKWMDREKTKPAYELWKPGDPVVPLDSKPKSRYDKEKDNPDKGRDLRPNYGLNIHVIVWEDGSDTPRYGQFSVYGDDADPNSKKFILPKLADLWMVPVTLKCEANEKKTTDSMISLKPGSGGRYVVKKLKVPDFDMYNLVNAAKPIVGMPKWTGDAFDKKKVVREIMIEVAGNPMPYTPPIPQIDLENIREYHEKFQMQTDDKGEALLNEKGKHAGEQATNYNQIAYIECTITPKKEPDPDSDSSIIVGVADNSFAKGKFSSFLPRLFSKLPFTKDCADVGMFVTTKKGADYYDPDLHARVKDEDGTRGEIGMSCINLFVIAERDLEKKDDEEEEDKPQEKDEGTIPEDKKSAAQDEMKV